MCGYDGIDIVGDDEKQPFASIESLAGLIDMNTSLVIVQYPDFFGTIQDLTAPSDVMTWSLALSPLVISTIPFCWSPRVTSRRTALPSCMINTIGLLAVVNTALAGICSTPGRTATVIVPRANIPGRNTRWGLATRTLPVNDRLEIIAAGRISAILPASDIPG